MPGVCTDVIGKTKFCPLNAVTGNTANLAAFIVCIDVERLWSGLLQVPSHVKVY